MSHQMISEGKHGLAGLDVATREAPSGRTSAVRIAVSGCLIGASVAAFTLVGSNLYNATTTAQSDACHMPDRYGTTASGRVIGFMPEADARALLAYTQKKLQATINPAYVSNQRALILVSTAEGVRHVTALVPAGLSVHVGEHVSFASGFRDRSLPCSYVPNLINDAAPIPK